MVRGQLSNKAAAPSPLPPPPSADRESNGMKIDDDDIDAGEERSSPESRADLPADDDRGIIANRNDNGGGVNIDDSHSPPGEAGDEESDGDDNNARRGGERGRKKDRRMEKASHPPASLFRFVPVEPNPGADDGPLARRTSTRKLKNVVRFDPRPLPGLGRSADCRVGEGFSCPRCYDACSYDARSCPNCGLECYYEAGVGAVALKERDDLTVDDMPAAMANKNNGKMRKRGMPYTGEERRMLLEGVELFGAGRWVEILGHYGDFAKNDRTAVNLKDLYRTLTKMPKKKYMKKLDSV